MSEDDPSRSIIQTLITERDELKRHCLRLQAVLHNMSVKAGFPPGHFYSPVVDATDPHAVAAARGRLSSPPPEGVVIDSAAMALLMTRLAVHHRLFPFSRYKSPKYRFYFDNPLFGCHDAAAFFSILLEFRPRRVIEVGSGYSSCLLLDTNEEFFGNRIKITLIDPSLESLMALVDPKGTSGAHLLPRPLQNVSLDLFDSLEDGDILFIDSSHVSKTGSDVNYYLFQILPRLRSGVLIHVHDILYPFEYPEEWVLKEKRSWNEAYLLRSFLQYNTAFGILYWTNFVWRRMMDDLRRLIPLCVENEGGSLWLRKQ